MEAIEENRWEATIAKLHCRNRTTRGYDIMDNGPLELLQFIQQFNLGISVPNIVLMLRIFLRLESALPAVSAVSLS